MVPFDMQMDARMMLARMSVIYEREVGNKIRMSRDEDIVTLINYAVESINDEVGKLYKQFLSLLSPGEIKVLAAQGANIYRGAVVSDSAVCENPQSDESQPKMYRGVALPPSQEPSTSRADSNGESATPAKPKRVYRGRVIED